MTKYLLGILLILFVNPFFAQDSDSLEIEKFNKLMSSGKFDEVIKETTKQLKSSGKPYIYEFKALAHYELSEFQESHDTYAEGIWLNPKSFVLHIAFSELYLELGYEDDAIEMAKRAYNCAENTSQKNSALINQGIAYSHIREFQKAHDLYKSVLEADSLNIAALINIGATCDNLGKPLDGIEYLKRAVALDTAFIAGYGNIGFLYQEMGDYEKALEYCNIVVKMDPNDPLGYSNRSYNYLMLGRAKEAKSDIDRSISIYPTNSYAYMVKGLVLVELKEPKQACTAFNKALELGFTKNYGDRVEKLMLEHCK